MKSIFVKTKKELTKLYTKLHNKGYKMRSEQIFGVEPSIDSMKCPLYLNIGKYAVFDNDKTLSWSSVQDVKGNKNKTDIIITEELDEWLAKKNK